eukprot:TRINITY_DN9347_c0_g2_i1.p1 TRINITY_DN9347_c0_g2~~TRINITY_DN9347_c0_g2_i1.p1  ORF type:complete len:242 (-),score=61.92 TRINITY_DN9347_c0_g2_i1:70-795(-)
MKIVRTEELKMGVRKAATPTNAKLRSISQSNNERTAVNEAAETIIVLKEIINKLQEKYKAEKIKNANLARKECYYKAELEGVNGEAMTLRKQNAKVVEKLTKCTEFIGQLMKETEHYNPIENAKLVARLTKENEYLRNLLKEKAEVRKKLKLSKATKARRKTMDHIESDGDESEGQRISVAVKLLMLKFKFERQRIYLKHKKAEIKDSDKNSEDTTSISDKVKQFGNLKPKQQFIFMENKE